jgi:hypothetical protein
VDCTDRLFFKFAFSSLNSKLLMSQVLHSYIKGPSLVQTNYSEVTAFEFHLFDNRIESACVNFHLVASRSFWMNDLFFDFLNLFFIGHIIHDLEISLIGGPGVVLYVPFLHG